MLNAILPLVLALAGNDAAAKAFKDETGIAVYKFDVGDFAACEAGLAAIVAEQGPIEILVNNAGITRDATMLRMRRDAPCGRPCALCGRGCELAPPFAVLRRGGAC